MLGIVILGYLAPHPFLSSRETKTIGLVRFWLVGFLGTVALFLMAWVLPQTEVSPQLTIFLMLLLCLVAALVVLRMTGNGYRWSERHRWALITGCLTFLILLAPLVELGNPSDFLGMGLVGLFAALFLIWVFLRINKKEKSIIAPSSRWERAL